MKIDSFKKVMVKINTIKYFNGEYSMSDTIKQISRLFVESTEFTNNKLECILTEFKHQYLSLNSINGKSAVLNVIVFDFIEHLNSDKNN